MSEETTSLKEVYFGLYCNDCKHRKLTEDDHPCDECLAIPVRENSHVPEKFERVGK